MRSRKLQNAIGAGLNRYARIALPKKFNVATFHPTVVCYCSERTREVIGMTITIELTPLQGAQLTAEAEREGLDPARVVERLVAEPLHQYPSSNKIQCLRCSQSGTKRTVA